MPCNAQSIFALLLETGISGVLPDNDDKQYHCKHDGEDNDDEVQDVFFQGGHASLGLIGQLSNTTEDGLIASSHDNTDSTARNTVCTLHANASCLKIVVIR